MGRNAVLGCLSCSCFSSPGKGYANNGFAADANNGSSSDSEVPLPPSGIHASLFSGNGFSADTGSSPDSEVRSSRIHHEVPSYKLMPLPRDRAFPDHSVGIDDQVNSVIRLLEWEDETNVAVAVILHGFGGTGKTTLGDAVVATLDIQGWNCSTVVPFQSMGNFEDGPGEMQEQAFIFIDNVTVREEHLQKLLSKPCKKLRLLLTARDEVVADVISGCGILTHVYSVRPLHSQDAMKLLCNKMGMQIPQQNMEEILKICDGVPVVLKRVGAFICQSPDKDEAYRRVIEWSQDGKPFTSAQEYTIEKKGLLFDLEELPASAKEPFLDICSFFNGWDWDKVSCIMGEDELNILRKRAIFLKKEGNENKAMLRHIILTIGRNMAKGNRFTSAHDLTMVLEAGNLDDIGGIKGIWLQDNKSEPFPISAEKLDLMHNSIRVLALGDMAIIVDGQCTQKFKQIVYFQAGTVPSIPFHPSTLQELRYLDWLPHKNNDLQLTKMSSKLTMLYMNGVRSVTGSAFGRMLSLRTLKLTEFNRLEILPKGLELLTRLEELDLGRCGKLVLLPKGLGDLKFLSKLSLRYCKSLQELPDCFGKLRSLKYLDLNSCESLEHLPEDFGSLSNLEELDLGDCRNLRELPSSFGKLSSLKLLTLVRCHRLDHLHDDIRNLSALVRTQFDASHLVSIPCRHIKLVKNLSVYWCRELTNLPKRLIELSSIRNLDLYGWVKLKRLPEGFGQLKSLAELNLECCFTLQELSSDFHYLPLLQILNLKCCEKLEGKWMDSLREIKTLHLVNIYECPMLLKRWAEMAQKGGSCRFAVKGAQLTWENLENVENMLNKAASKLLSGECLLTNSLGEPFSLSTLAPNTLLLVIYDLSQCKFLEEVVKHEDRLPFQMIYVGKWFGDLSKIIAKKIMAYACVESDVHLFFTKVANVKTKRYHNFDKFLVTKIVADEGGRKHFSTWEDISDSFVEFLLSKSTVYSRLQKLAETPQENNLKLLRALFNSAESSESSIFLRNYRENIGVDRLYGKTLLLFISVDEHHVIDEHLFMSLKEIYSKAKRNDDMEMISIPIPAEVTGGRQRSPGSDLARFESILGNVPWLVLRNPWSLKTEVYYFLLGEYRYARNPTILLVVVDPTGRICNKNALPLVERWGAEVYPFTDEKIKQLEQQTLQDSDAESAISVVEVQADTVEEVEADIEFYQVL